MKKIEYYYGNNWKEAMANKPVALNAKQLKQYKENYNFVMEKTQADALFPLSQEPKTR